MKILNDRKLIELQKEFQESFPFLKLEFYMEHHKRGEGSPVNQQIDPQKTIQEIKDTSNEGDLSLRPDQKISTLEKNFKEQYGINVQVFRKSGNLWLQSNKTDYWTLADANRKGEHSVIHYQKKYES